MTETILNTEVLMPVRKAEVVLPKRSKLASNTRVWSSRYRGFGQRKLADGRFAVCFSCVTPAVWQLMGSIYASGDMG